MPDHLGPDKGFGQMGMGDYHLKLAGYCRSFVEDFGNRGDLRRAATFGPAWVLVENSQNAAGDAYLTVGGHGHPHGLLA